MKSKAMVSVILAVSMTAGGFAHGQNAGERDNRDRNEQRYQRGEPQDRRVDQIQRQQNRGDQSGRPQDRRDYQGRANSNQRWEERGVGPNHEFRRGGRLPPEYRHRQYVVDNWREHRLSAPPRGYHWVQVGGDYVLVAIATGIIMQLLMNN